MQPLVLSQHCLGRPILSILQEVPKWKPGEPGDDPNQLDKAYRLPITHPFDGFYLLQYVQCPFWCRPKIFLLCHWLKYI